MTHVSMDWGSLPRDIIEEILKKVQITRPIACASGVNKHWKCVADELPGSTYSYVSYRGAPLDHLLSFAKFVLNKPENSIEDMLLRFDIWDAPYEPWPVRLGKIRKALEILTMALERQKTSLRSIMLHFMNKKVSPSKMRMIVHPLLPTWTRLCRVLQGCPGLLVLDMQGGVLPLGISKDVRFKASWMLVEQYNVPSNLSVRALVMKMESSRHQSATVHMLLKTPPNVFPLLLHEYAVEFLDRLYLRRNDPVMLYGVETTDQTISVHIKDFSGNSPCSVVRDITTRATNLSVFANVPGSFNTFIETCERLGVNPNASIGLRCVRLPF